MKIILTMISIISLFAFSLQADAWKIEGGTGLWEGSADGTIFHQGNTHLFTLTLPEQVLTDNIGDDKDEISGYLYLTIKHPIAFVPNICFEYVKVQGAGKISYETDTTNLFRSVGTLTVDSQLILTQYDTILFYNVLDEQFWTTVAVGVDVKYLRSEYYVPDLNVDSSSNSIIPMAYVRGRVEVPTVPIGLEADIKYITDGKSILYDTRLKIDYTFKMDKAFEPGVELGYRLQRFNVDGEKSNYLGDIFSESSDTDVTFSGLYGGLNVKF